MRLSLWSVLTVAVRRGQALSLLKRNLFYPRRFSQVSSSESAIVAHSALSARSIYEEAVEEEDDNNDEDDDDEEEESTELGAPGELESPKYKNFEVMQLRSMEEEGRLVLKPFYQRGYKWTQKQASSWIESILRGYPCLPEVTLLQNEDSDGATQYATFDGQQRLTSIIAFINNKRGDHWKTNKVQRSKNLDASFALESMTMLKHLEGSTYRDLTQREQNKIKNYDIRCAIIPSSWSMSDYIEFFKRIQGGGTPMSDHELRRAISRGPFTELLDELATSPEVLNVFDGCSLQPDDIQQLLLRHFALQSCSNSDMKKFGKPSIPQYGLETMKQLNKEMESWAAQDKYAKREEMIKPLLHSLKLVSTVFHKHEAFRRPVPLVKNDEVQIPKKVWVNSNNVHTAIWDAVVYCFRKLDKRSQSEVQRNSELFRSAIIELMQTSPVFTESLRVTETDKRIAVLYSKILETMQQADTLEHAQIPQQTRKDLIASALKSKAPCPLCNSPLSQFEDHLHIDHITPRSRGGKNTLDNLQVVHKTCNLRKSDKVLSSEQQVK